MTKGKILHSRLERLAKLKKLSLRLKQDVPAKPETGVIYLGHLPPSFEEDGLKKYFMQFGRVLRVKLSRSKKTGRSRCYGFLEFEDKEVADIAADTMHGFIMFGKQMVCKVMPPEKVHPMLFSGLGRPFVPYPKYKDFQKRYNAEQEPEEVQERVKKLLKSEDTLREKLKEQGIQYDFPGYKSLLDNSH